MKKQIFLLTTLLGMVSVTYAQRVADVQASTFKNKIVLTYYITGLKYYQDITQINFYVSRDNGQTYEGPLKEISGDIGPGLRNGKHTVLWDVLKEMPFTEGNFIFDVRLSVKDNPRPKSFMISLVGNLNTPLGLRIGQLGRTGWYVEGRASLSPLTKENYHYENGAVTDYDKPGYYQFNDNKLLAAWSAVGGVTFQASWNLFFNIGAGYSVNNYLYGIDEYSYENDTQTGNALVRNNETSYSGVELDAGIILKFNKFIISGNATAVNFNTFGWTAGIGLAF